MGVWSGNQLYLVLIDFFPSSKPGPGDVFEITVNRPFATSDTIKFSVTENDIESLSQLNGKIWKI